MQYAAIGLTGISPNSHRRIVRPPFLPMPHTSARSFWLRQRASRAALNCAGVIYRTRRLRSPCRRSTSFLRSMGSRSCRGPIIAHFDILGCRTKRPIYPTADIPADSCHGAELSAKIVNNCHAAFALGREVCVCMNNDFHLSIS